MICGQMDGCKHETGECGAECKGEHGVTINTVMDG